MLKYMCMPVRRRLFSESGGTEQPRHHLIVQSYQLRHQNNVIILNCEIDSTNCFAIFIVALNK